MARFDGFGWRQRRLSRAGGSGGAVFQGVDMTASRDNYPADGYEAPRLMVIGRVRKFSTGSSSSGKADANTQYYW